MTEGLPLILTLMLDEDTFAFFDRLRRRHFPPALNYLSAHLTLFHHLPPDEPRIREDLRRCAARTKCLALHIEAVAGTGRGVAYKVASEELRRLHRELQQLWWPWLTPQDRQTLWPHVTVQNKVTPAEARATLDELRNGFEPFNGRGPGLALWHYEGGPWRFSETFLFKE